MEKADNMLHHHENCNRIDITCLCKRRLWMDCDAVGQVRRSNLEDEKKKERTILFISPQGENASLHLTPFTCICIHTAKYTHMQLAAGSPMWSTQGGLRALLKGPQWWPNG